jgi:hypothetical protein
MVKAAMLACGNHVRAADTEDKLKSATVLMFLRIGEWHGQAGKDRPITVGVIGRPALFEALNPAVSAKFGKKRAVPGMDLNSAADAACCDAVYIASEKPTEIQAVLAVRCAVRALTLGESDCFLESGGAVSLLLNEDRSSKPLRLGRVRKSGNIRSSR